MIRIDKSIPVPEPTVGGLKYPLLEMEGGDSFFIPLGTRCRHKIYHCVKSSAYAAMRRSNINFEITSRSVTEDGVEGVRFWKLAARIQAEPAPLQIRRAA